MSFNSDGVLDQDEALRLLDLATREDTGRDVVLRVESKGVVYEGESERQFEDGKQRMAVLGYFLSNRVETPPGTSKGRVVNGPLTLVRSSDAATASLASLLQSQASDLKVTLAVFRAGGDDSKDAQPMLQMDLQDARLAVHCVLSGGHLGRPAEVLGFTYRTLTMSSAPQAKSGLRGAVRTCVFGG
ncbi:type VI secretion system tube protein Hcp [Xenophilus arseniciresistens]|uniref:Type VI secretion system tube protein Hcp n=1 Tax=Xenophilus arseniciresistens TaxID=1283306 RepID=A0AAE3T123_9BURK|nr:type VI secretion system tube protein Hcp [Xenophilus arseniciresistens]MDA7418759.1 type VI secretion system tube protein Hcp [Xenophilus arseniciresistens]